MITFTQVIIGMILVAGGMFIGWRERTNVERRRREWRRECNARQILRRL